MIDCCNIFSNKGNKNNIFITNNYNKFLNSQYLLNIYLKFNRNYSNNINIIIIVLIDVDMNIEKC